MVLDSFWLFTPYFCLMDCEFCFLVVKVLHLCLVRFIVSVVCLFAWYCHFLDVELFVSVVEFGVFWVWTFLLWWIVCYFWMEICWNRGLWGWYKTGFCDFWCILGSCVFLCFGFDGVCWFGWFGFWMFAIFWCFWGSLEILGVLRLVT